MGQAEVDMQAFYLGRSFDAWRWMGARVEGEGARFCVFAPAARAVDVVVGDRVLPMERCLNGQFFSAFVLGAREGETYLYRVHQGDGTCQEHCDPYGTRMELRPAHRSVLCELGGRVWRDGAWMAGRTACLDRPLSIYELHLGSWRKPGPEPDSWYRYDELAGPLIEHVRSLGFTHVELMPLAEYPFDGSWGYQGCAPFAATSRYGTPEQLMELVDRLHQAGIGVILDFVPVHFATDAWGLANFDGTPLYEYPNDAVGVSEWGSHNFMHSRGEVRSLLASAADFWLGTYHFDGLRLDAVSRIVYWQGDEARGANALGVDFLRGLTEGLHERHSGCMLIAEDSSNFPGVTRPPASGGLGFDYKWDLGWMHDTLSYFQMPPEERRGAEGRLTFSMLYYPNERYLLPFSHDESVHGKATIAQKMNGDYWGKFGQARALYLYMTVHPGKMLDFMGNEFAQLREWDERREQDWCLLDFPVHDAFLRYRRELSALYLAHPALWALDYEGDGFAWLDCEQRSPCCTAILRRGGGETLAALFNLDGEAHEHTVPLPDDCATAVRPEVLLVTDWERFGGDTPDGQESCALGEACLTARLAPLSGMLVRLSRC